MAQRERRMVAAVPIPDETGPMQDGLPRQFWVRVVSFAQLDDFGTKFDRAAFSEYLQHRMPRFLYGHNWSDPTALIGKGIDSRSSKDGLDILFSLDDFGYVPVARQIAYQVQNGTLDQFSVDFIRERDKRDADGVVWITKARLPAVSGVPEGAVPGTKVLTRASGLQTADPSATVPLASALGVLSRLALGEIKLPDAWAQLEEVSSSSEGDDEGEENEDDPDKTKAEGDSGEEGDGEPPEGTPEPPEGAEGPEAATEPPEATEGNGEGTEPPAADDAADLALADDALAIIGRH